MPETRVHVIDDDDGVRDSLVFLLDCAGLNVTSYASANAFLEAAPMLQGACIVTDVRMPGLSGVELVQELKAMGVDAPVIIMTGHADVPMAIQAMKAGVADFIEKPFSDETMLEAIRGALARQADHARCRGDVQLVRERVGTLSAREKEVLEGLVAGHANKVIAANLDISPRTVEVYRANLMTKMHARSLSELVRMMAVLELAST